MSIRLQIQGKTKQEKKDMLKDAILRYLQRNPGPQSTEKLANAMGYTKQTIKQNTTYLGRARQELMDEGLIKYTQWQGYALTEAGEDHLGEEEVETVQEMAALPSGASGPASEVLKDLVHRLKLSYPKLSKELEENVWVESINNGSASVCFMHTVNPDIFNVYSERVLDKQAVAVYGTPIYFNVRQELVSTSESRASLPERIFSLIESVVGPKNMEFLDDLTFKKGGWEISVRKPFKWGSDDTEE